MARIARLAVMVLLVASSAWAQAWRGDGKMSGKVVDEAGKPVEGAVVKAYHPPVNSGVAVKTNNKGEWKIDNAKKGEWILQFEMPEYITTQAALTIPEKGKLDPLNTTLKKGVDPNAFVQGEVAKANDLVNQKKFAEARAIYEGIVAKYPQVVQVHQLVARMHYMEGNTPKAIEYLRGLLAKDPENLATKLYLASLLFDTGSIDEGKTMLVGVDETKLPDMGLYVNFGVMALKHKKNADAIGFFDKVLARDQSMPEVYYYRALGYVELANAQGQEAQRADNLAKAKADLTKFLELAPSSADADSAKKLLEQIK